MEIDREEAEVELANRELERRYPGLAEMVRKGLVRLPLKLKGPNAYPLLPRVTPLGTAARLLDEERGDR